jgi:hypothetical protein
MLNRLNYITYQIFQYKLWKTQKTNGFKIKSSQNIFKQQMALNKHLHPKKAINPFISEWIRLYTYLQITG